MKKVYLKIYLVMSCMLLLPSFGGVCGGLFAQDPELFEHTWYFSIGEINNEPLLLPLTPENFYSAIHFFEDSNELYGFSTQYSHCEAGCGADIIFFIDEPVFEIITTVCFTSNCPLETEMYEFEMKVNLFYGMLTTVPNPFTYNIITVNDYSQLTIENGEGDWAVYNSILLSTPTFHQNSLTLYPNPVKEILKINNASNELVKAIIYNINGKKTQTHSLENNVSTLNVKALNPGLYFVVFENENGERVSEKFIKH